MKVYEGDLGDENVVKKPKIWLTNAFYDKKGRRLSIKYNNDVISVVTCSLEDSFNKKEARRLHTESSEGVLYYIEKFTTRREFLQWCKDNYYRKLGISIRINTNTMKSVSVKRGKDFLIVEYIMKEKDMLEDEQEFENQMNANDD